MCIDSEPDPEPVPIAFAESHVGVRLLPPDDGAMIVSFSESSGRRATGCAPLGTTGYSNELAYIKKCSEIYFKYFQKLGVSMFRVDTSENIADIFTKYLSEQTLTYLVRKPFGLTLDEKHRGVKHHDSDCEFSGSEDYGLPATSVCTCKKKLLLIGMLANLPQFRAQSIQEIPTTLGTILGVDTMTLGIALMVPLSMAAVFLVVSSSSTRPIQEPSSSFGGLCPGYIVSSDDQSDSGDSWKEVGTGVAAKGKARNTPKRDVEQPARGVEPQAGWLTVNICDFDKDVFWRFANEHALRSGGVPVDFKKKALVPDLIAYLKKAGVRGGLTRFRKDQLRIGCFFVFAAINADQLGHTFP